MRSNVMKLFRSRVLLVGAVLAVACLAQAMTATLATAAPPPANLTNWWPFDETSGTIAHNLGPDPTVLQPQGVLQGGAAFATGCVGNGVHINSSADFVEAPDAPSIDFGTGSFTIKASVRTSTSASGIPIVDHRVINPDIQHPLGYILYLSNGTLAFQLGDAGGLSTINFISPSPTLNDGVCHCVAVTVDRAGGTTGGHLYADGVSVLTFNPTVRSASNSNTGPLRIGQECPGFLTRTFTGDIDEVQLYSRALSAAEVASICPSTDKCTPFPSNLAAWWRLDETSGTTAKEELFQFLGTYVGSASHQAGVVNGGVHIASASDYVSASIGPNFTANTSFSVDAWVRTSDVSASVIPIVDHRVTDPDVFHPRGYILFSNNGKLAFQLGDGGPTTNFISTAPTLTDGLWHFVAATIDRAGGTTGGHLYVDGISVLTFDPTLRPGSVSNTGPLRIGQECPGLFTRTFTGDIDEVEIYSKALPQPDVTSLYNAGSNGKCPATFVPGVDRNGLLVMSLLLLLGGTYAMLRKRARGSLTV